MSNNANTPDIDSGTIRLLLHDFRSHIVGCAYDIIKSLVLGEDARKSEVSYFDVQRIAFLLLLDQDVLGFDVAMDYISFVHIIECK